jgi:hypothetical protein
LVNSIFVFIESYINGYCDQVLNILYLVIVLSSFILIIILFISFMDPLNKILNRSRRTNSFTKSHIAEYKRGSRDGKDVDLSFFNVSSEIYQPDPEEPSKIIFDKNDPSGSILPILFPYGSLVCEFLRDGVRYTGYTNSAFNSEKSEVGTMEYVTENCYRITVTKPADYILRDLRRRGIYIFSGNWPLTHTTLITGAGDGCPNTYVYVYAERKDAIGVFTNDTSVLPSR